MVIGKDAVLICSECDSVVTDPDFTRPLPWPLRPRWQPGPTPLCSNGHKVRNWILGVTYEQTLPWAFLRGFAICSLLLIQGDLLDLRHRRPGYPVNHFGFQLSTAAALIFAAISFTYAWNWAGRKGPVNRLAARACGSALGFGVPAITASHAIYFHWLDALQSATGAGILSLFQFATRLHNANH